MPLTFPDRIISALQDRHPGYRVVQIGFMINPDEGPMPDPETLDLEMAAAIKTARLVNPVFN